MPALICGSLAFDTITTFPGRFAQQILPDQVHILNVSFLVPTLRREFGGCAGNIAYTLHALGGAPVPMAALGIGCGVIAFGMSRWLWVSLALMLFTGFALLRGTVGTNTIIQTLMEEKMRGRVMGYYMMVLEGMGPWGALIAGGLAQRLGAPHAVMISGVACILGGLWFWTRIGRVRAAMRPIYEQLGIVPMVVVSDGIES